MTLYEKAQDIADDYSKKLLRKRWQSRLFAAKLFDLRSRNHYKDWKDGYDINFSGQGSRPSRYKLYFEKRVEGGLICPGVSDGDCGPFDDRFRDQGGLLRA